MSTVNSNKRSIEQFELSSEYYSESWDNGNKSHVLQELKELKQCSEKVFLRIFLEIPSKIQERFQEEM